MVFFLCSVRKIKFFIMLLCAPLGLVTPLGFYKNNEETEKSLFCKPSKDLEKSVSSQVKLQKAAEQQRPPVSSV